ncbi:MAG: gliding motility protein GldN [Chitinophagales bacterium]|nr:gliding motility protein GldN [Chitinophagales bacterium]
MKVLSAIVLSAGLIFMTASAIAQNVQDAPLDNAYEPITVEDKGIIPYDHIREADVFWEKRIWRVIDVREKMNLVFKYPKQYFVNILRDAAIEGTIAVYDGADDEFTKRIAPGEVASLGVGTADTVMVWDPETETETATVSAAIFDPEKVTKFRLKEVWIFDEETSTMVVRILGIAPIMDVIDDQGNFRGEQPLFWVYYPEARQLLAKYPVFNTGNDAQQNSWEDLMEMRFFSSYIIKERNVYDRRIQDYAAGIDALYESDRIKEQIMEFEHDLWSF